MDKEIIYRFFEGSATIDEKKLIKAWTDAADENRKELFRERKLYDAMILTGQLNEKVAASAIKRRQLVIRELLKIASVVLVTVSVTLLLLYSPMDNEPTMATITVPAGQRATISLPDGTNVWLNACSRMQYPSSFARDKREIILDGEAYFDVRHNAGCPFVVHAGKYAIEVLGTKFNVESYSDRKEFETSLMEGKVKIASSDGDVSPIFLQPNHKAVLVNGRLEMHVITDFNAFRWKEGLICFKDVAFKDIMKRFEKSYDIRIQINNKRISDVLLTGKFRLTDGIDYALRVLQKDVSFRCERSENNDVIYIE